MTDSKQVSSTTGNLNSRKRLALAAVGLATVLVGCGGGSTTVGNTTGEPMPGGEPTTGEPTTGESMTEEPMTGESMTPEPPSSSADPDPKAVAEEASTTARDLVGSLDTYSASRDQDLALAALEALKTASEDENLSATDQQKYMDEYEKLKTEVDDIQKIQEERAQQQRERDQTAQQQQQQRERRNALASLWIDAIGRWDDETGEEGFSSLDLKDGLNVRTPMVSDVVDTDYLSTKIRAFRLNSQGASLGEGMEIEGPGEAWTARKFQTAEGQYLKIFTNHGGAETIFSETWEEFQGANNDPDYFESNDYNYYKDAFGDPNVEFSTVQGNQTIKVLTTKEGLSSAIHVSDIDIKIAGESITLSSTTPLRLDSLAGPEAFTFGELKGEIQNLTVSLFGQNIPQPFCAQTVPGSVLNNSASACEVTLNPDGHLVVKGDTAKGYLNFATASTRNNLASQQVVLERPDTRYTVMGYWMDEEGDSYNIDTFATARYGPRDSTGLTENIGQLAGTATYAGDAVGVYVMNKGDETNLDLHDGEFKATVSLQANFGTSNPSSNDSAFTVNGTIKSFESVTRSDDDDLSAWTLDLNQSSVNNSDGSFSGTTTGEGNWQGQFYGKDNLDTAVTTDDLPLAAVGDFSGDFGNSNRVIGVFSAETTEE